MADLATQPLPPWLEEAQTLSTARWYSAVLDLSTLQLHRIDEQEFGYQRPISESRVESLVENFDAGEARDIYVSEREDGTRWVLDGQHTLEALKRVGLKKRSCRVFRGLSVAQG